MNKRSPTTLSKDEFVPENKFSLDPCLEILYQARTLSISILTKLRSISKSELPRNNP